MTSFTPKVFEVGKPATIECDIVYNDKEKIKLTTLYFVNDIGALNEIGDNNDDEVFENNPVNDRADISIKAKKIEIKFKELRYNDKFTFLCEATGAHKDFSNSQIINRTIAVQNVEGIIQKYSNMNVISIYYDSFLSPLNILKTRLENVTIVSFVVFYKREFLYTNYTLSNAAEISTAH